MVRVNVELDLPVGVELLGYERHGEGHGFEVKFPLPDSCRCELCGHEEAATYEYKNTVYAARDLDLWGQSSFWIFQPCFHRCSRCGHRQEHFASFKRKKVMYTYRFEEYVLRMLIGSNEEEVAQRLGISAETVTLIIENQLKDDKKVDPERVIKHVGMDELSLKKRHKLYGPACAALLHNSRLVVDRFHVAKQFNDVVDDLRKKTRESTRPDCRRPSRSGSAR